MTIQKARNILGDQIKDLSDQEVEKLIAESSIFCDALIEVFEDYLTLSKEDNYNEERICKNE